MKCALDLGMMLRLFSIVFISSPLWLAMAFPSSSMASVLDRDYIYPKIVNSGCNFDAKATSEQFGKAIDRLQEINPELVDEIRSVSYLKSFSIKCDLPSDSNGIYWDRKDMTIHLKIQSTDGVRVVANIFHEFLHFVGVKIDLEQHRNFSRTRNFAADSVYGCHIFLFPKVLFLEKDEAEILSAAKKGCALAKVDRPKPPKYSTSQAATSSKNYSPGSP